MEHGNESVISVKGGELLNQLGDCQILNTSLLHGVCCLSDREGSAYSQIFHYFFIVFEVLILLSVCERETELWWMWM
jgi:hypothetical protein